MSEEDDDFDEEEEDKEEIVAEEEEEEDGEELMEKSMRGVNGNNGTNDRKHWTKSSTATTSNDKDPDNEISVLLRKKQERLRELFYKSRPTIETLYARVLKEYAVHEAIHKMDEADNKLYKIASKFENTTTSLNPEQRQEMQAALKEHNIQYASFHGLKK
ncbi:unnamed protein product [Meloidogyne enterolobii]|uniref:Uncharacterized protein n=1 Tax=Meloidogyne enterolobii TaxID=390850 RepID=A0ACB1AUL4_MELEN